MKPIYKVIFTFLFTLILIPILHNTAYAGIKSELKTDVSNMVMDAISNGEARILIQDIMIEANKDSNINDVANVGIIDDMFKGHMTEMNTATVLKMIDESIAKINNQSNILDSGKALVDEIKNWKNGSAFQEAREKIKQTFVDSGKTGYETFFETDSGKIILDFINDTKIGDKKIDQYYKTQEQLLKEAYKAIGLDGIDPIVLSTLFDFKVDNYDLYKASLTGEEKEYINNMKLQFGIALQPTDKAIEFMKTIGGDYHTWGDLFAAYERSTGKRIRSQSDLNDLTTAMEKDKAILEELFKTGIMYTDSISASHGVAKYRMGDGEIDLFVEGLLGGKDKSGSVKMYSNELLAKLREFEKKYGIPYWKTTIALKPELIKFVTKPGEVLGELNLPGVNSEWFYFITKVKFIITRKDDKPIGKIMLADYDHRKQLALERSSVSGTTHGQIYQNIMGYSIPDTRLERVSNYTYECTIDYLSPIKQKYRNSYYDVIRKNYSGINGSVFNYRNFMPTISIDKDSDVGLYEVRVQIEAMGYQEIQKTFYYEVCSGEGEDRSCENKNGQYYPWRQRPDGDSTPEEHYSNKTPDKEFLQDIGDAIWEINKSAGSIVDTDLPLYEDADKFRITNFITK